MKCLYTIVCIGLFVLPVFSQEIMLQHKYIAGAEYRIIGVNTQDVFVNGKKLGRAEILTRALFEITEVQNNRAYIQSEYQISETALSSSKPFALSRTLFGAFQQDIWGMQTEFQNEWIPPVRNIPVFPQRSVAVGEEWTIPVKEIYDMREILHVSTPIEITTDAHYRYIGTAELDGKELEEIHIQYNVLHRPQSESSYAQYIRLITARHSQKLFWDAEEGAPYYYEEKYNLFVHSTDGNRFEYQGTADGRLAASLPLNRDSVSKKIEEAIAEEQIPDTSVKSDESGVIIVLENIQFSPDSAELLPSEQQKLEWISTILSQYPHRDVLVTGHTALAGTESGRQKLSEERAAAVGEYLIRLGVRDRESLIYQGKGAKEQVASNDSEAGRRKNRRVEITILEN